MDKEVSLHNLRIRKDNGSIVTSIKLNPLSLILLSCMVMPNREIVNLNIFTFTSAISNPIESKASSEDILMGALRGRSIISSTNSLRESSILSKVSSIEYSACMEAQSADINWANQTENKLFRLLYAILSGGESNV